jgi:hypothetical protein
MSKPIHHPSNQPTAALNLSPIHMTLNFQSARRSPCPMLKMNWTLHYHINIRLKKTKEEKVKKKDDRERATEAMEKQRPAIGAAAPSAKSKTEVVNPPLHAFGFEIEESSPQKVTGRLHVTHNCCQVSLTLSLFFPCLCVSGSACPVPPLHLLVSLFEDAFLLKKTAIQGAAWRGIGSDSWGAGKHGSPHGFGFPGSGWNST